MAQNLPAADIKTPAGVVHIGDDWVGKTLAVSCVNRLGWSFRRYARWRRSGIE